MNKKKILIIVGILAIIIIASSLIYITFIADQTYEDDRLSISVPAGTEFNIKAVDAGNGLSKIIYNDTSDKNIVIVMTYIPNSTVFGVSMGDLGIGLQEETLKNQSYNSVRITENYTIYKNEKTGRYNALIRNPGYTGYVLIGCNGEIEDIVKLADSFKFKSYTKEGLQIEKVNNTSNITDNSTNTPTKTVKTESKKTTKKTTTKELTSEDIENGNVNNGDTYTDDFGVKGTYKNDGFYDDDGNALIG